jgi:ribosomal protein S11
MTNIRMMRPIAMDITPIDGEFWWHVGFTNDPRLPRMGRAATFEKALAAVRQAIKTINDNGPIPTEDRRPIQVQA